MEIECKWRGSLCQTPPWMKQVEILSISQKKQSSIAIVFSVKWYEITFLKTIIFIDPSFVKNYSNRTLYFEKWRQSLLDRTFLKLAGEIYWRVYWQPILCLDWLFKGEKNILNVDVGDCVFFFDLNKEILTPTISKFKFYKAVKITFQQNDWATKFNHCLADAFEQVRIH